MRVKGKMRETIGAAARIERGISSVRKKTGGGVRADLRVEKHREDNKTLQKKIRSGSSDS